MLTGDQPITALKGVGPRRAKALEDAGIFTLSDLVSWVPKDYIDLSRLPNWRQASHGERAYLIGIIATQPRTHRPRPRFSVTRVSVEDEGRRVQCVWFNQPYLARQLQPGGRFLFTGVVDRRTGVNQLVSPLREPLAPGEMPAILPLYPAVGQVASRTLRGLVRQALDLLDDADPLPEAFRRQYGLQGLGEALRSIHMPTDQGRLQKARERLYYEKMLVLILMLRLQRTTAEGESGIALRPDPEAMDAFWAGLPFAPTAAQRRCVGEILADMAAPKAMNRLVQGDVGSGKTLVALASLYAAVRCGCQAALMAPTELLAQQHYEQAQRLLGPLGVSCGLLTGSSAGAPRRQALAAMESGAWQVVIGTHALIQPGVAYRDLALVVTDEQHRFGVRQRAQLRGKGASPDMLVMSATPIPRTTALVLYGDLDVSILDELPPGRQPIRTRVVPQEKRMEMYRFVAQQVNVREQAYIVCPLIEDSEELEAPSAQGLYEELKDGPLKNIQAGLVHGRMTAQQKEDVLSAFRRGETRALVSTTVIEVGVDVPAATIIVVEHADRFGLAQLHQLRGRVGRGSRPSWCFLVPGEPGAEISARLNILVATQDGFRISEEDLRIRGPGALLGLEQAGFGDALVLQMLQGEQTLLRAQQMLRDLMEVADYAPAYAALLERAQREARLCAERVVMN